MASPIEDARELFIQACQNLEEALATDSVDTRIEAEETSFQNLLSCLASLEPLVKSAKPPTCKYHYDHYIFPK